MKSIVKKIAIFSMVGMMQIGLGASVIEASPLHNDGPQRIVQLDDRHHDNEKQREHDERQRQENERHEREMRRHDHESEREWHDRQERENQRHRNALDEIASLLIGIAIGSSSNN
jgi:membrane protein involved in colicin uptake